VNEVNASSPVLFAGFDPYVEVSISRIRLGCALALKVRIRVARMTAPRNLPEASWDRLWNGPRYLEVDGERVPLVKLEMPAFGRGPTAVAGKITGYTRHGLNQAMSRDGVGVGTKAILDAVRNPSKVIEQSDGAMKYVGANATVILNKAGEVVTTWARNASGWSIQP
jgi:hypothetical protein